jgi:hypothetical protein
MAAVPADIAVTGWVGEIHSKHRRCLRVQLSLTLPETIVGTDGALQREPGDLATSRGLGSVVVFFIVEM